MAEIDVKPKSKTPWWLWLILLLIVLALLYYFLRNNGAGIKSSDGADTTTNTRVDSSSSTTVATTTPWDNVNFDAPKASYNEITDTAISVRGGDKYTIYSLGENVLFPTDKSELQSSGNKQLQQVAASLQKRFKNAEIGIYGHTDSKGDQEHNKDLGAQRAEAVRAWLVSKGNIDESKVSVHSFGESQPVASNATPQGRQQNRSVEIVAMPDSTSTQQ